MKQVYMCFNVLLCPGPVQLQQTATTFQRGVGCGGDKPLDSLIMGGGGSDKEEFVLGSFCFCGWSGLG